MYQFELSGTPVQCETVAELHDALGPAQTHSPTPSHTDPAKAPKKRRGNSSKLKASWDAARKLAKKEGITVVEARAKIAKTKGDAGGV